MVKKLVEVQRFGVQRLKRTEVQELLLNITEAIQ